MAKEKTVGSEKKKPKGTKLSLVLSADTDALLDLSAMIRRVSRSARADAILLQGLKEDKKLAKYRALYFAEKKENGTDEADPDAIDSEDGEGRVGEPPAKAPAGEGRGRTRA